MTSKEFNDVVEQQLDYCKSLLVVKGQEYTPDSMGSGAELLEESNGQLVFAVTVDDRLKHFKKAASLMNTTPKAALFGMLNKHIISISDMCTDGRDYTLARWNEKITDTMNYLLLLQALCIEEAKNE